MTLREVCGTGDGKTFQITLRGQAHTFDGFQRAVHTLAPPRRGAGNFQVLNPLCSDGGFTVLINRGFVPLDRAGPATRPGSEPVDAPPRQPGFSSGLPVNPPTTPRSWRTTSVAGSPRSSRCSRPPLELTGLPFPMATSGSSSTRDFKTSTCSQEGGRPRPSPIGPWPWPCRVLERSSIPKLPGSSSTLISGLQGRRLDPASTVTRPTSRSAAIPISP